MYPWRISWCYSGEDAQWKLITLNRRGYHAEKVLNVGIRSLLEFLEKSMEELQKESLEKREKKNLFEISEGNPGGIH